jgi:tetrahydromethanopterin S-methyltransferase subunit A
MSKVIDLQEYKELKNKVNELINTDTGSLTLEQSSVMIHMLAKLTKQQSEVIEATLNTVALLTSKQSHMEDQFTWISCQAYMAIQILQEKGICTSEELNSQWEKLIREKIKKNESIVSTQSQNENPEHT